MCVCVGMLVCGTHTAACAYVCLQSFGLHFLRAAAEEMFEPIMGSIMSDSRLRRYISALA